MPHLLVSGALSTRFEKYSWVKIREALNTASRDAKRKSWTPWTFAVILWWWRKLSIFLYSLLLCILDFW